MVIKEYGNPQGKILLLLHPMLADGKTMTSLTLWKGLPKCYDESKVAEFRRKIYEYIYTRYKDVA